MTWRITHIYPFLFAIIPVVRIVAAYPGWAELDDAAVVLTTVLAACGVVYGLALLATRRRGDRLPPLVLLGVVLGFWAYVRVAPFVEHQTGLSHPVLLPLWAAATVGLIWWLVRRPALLDRAETFLTLSSGMLVGWFVLSIGIAEFRSARAVRQSTVVRQLAQPIQVQPAARVGPKRDIYLIILDEYANAEVTGRLLGFDNHVFLDSLRQLGFVVPAVHSNYLHTFLSLPSLLNAAHLADLSGEVGRWSIDRTVPDHLVKYNRTVRFLKSQGYQFVLFRSQTWEATQGSPQADREVGPGLDPARELTRSGLRMVLKKTSLLKFFELGAARYTRGHVTRTFAALAQAPKMSGPVFTFAHVMSPHGPYVFDRHCRPAHKKARGGSRLKQEAAPYVEQIQCVNHMLLDLVTTLLRTSEVPPVILLQGDHGSKMLLFDRAGTAEKITLAAAKERLGAFGAYYLPDHGSEVFGDSVTIVNVMGNVLRFYLGAALLREPDDMYLSVDPAPYAFKRVDFAWLAGEDWSVRPPGSGRSAQDARSGRQASCSSPPIRWRSQVIPRSAGSCC
jgi:Sulfatase